MSASTLDTNRLRAVKWAARRRGVPFGLTLEEWRRIVAKPCAFARMSGEGPELHKPSTTGAGLAVIEDGIGFVGSNVLPACKPCALRVGRVGVEAHLEHLGLSIDDLEDYRAEWSGEQDGDGEDVAP